MRCLSLRNFRVNHIKASSDGTSNNQKLGTPISTLTAEFLLTKARNSNGLRNKLAEDVVKLLRLLFALPFHCCADFNYHSGGSGKRKLWGQYQSFQRIFADCFKVKYANQWRPLVQTIGLLSGCLRHLIKLSYMELPSDSIVSLHRFRCIIQALN